LIHRVGAAIGVKDRAALDVAGGSGRSSGSEMWCCAGILPVGVQDGYERDFRKIQTFSQQVMPMSTSNFAAAQIT